MIKRIIMAVLCALLTSYAYADITFECKVDPTPYFKKFNISPIKVNNTYYLRDNTAWGTLFIKWNYDIHGVISEKEILIALLYPGRNTEYKTADCLQELKDDVGVRQNIVKWSSKLEWGWPGNRPDGKAKWNKKYWYRGTPHKGVDLHTALKDMFINQKEYAIGCYAAVKMVYAFAILDYWKQKGDKHKVELFTKLLMGIDGEPLVDVEPARMWYFEEGHVVEGEYYNEGKVLVLIDNVPPLNFVPGDFIYMLNTDPVSYQHIGYEGSNTIYLGQNRFVDYYNDNNYYYSYREKLDEIYNWRNEVFSMSRDYMKKEQFHHDFYEKYGESPENGGIVLPYRVVPKRF